MLTHRTKTILGDIPEDWNTTLLVNLLESQQGGDWGDDIGESALSVLRSTNFTNRGTLNYNDVATRYFPAAKTDKLGLKRNDVLLERSGGSPTQPVGRVGFITEDLPDHWFSNFVQMLRPDVDKIDPEFLGWILLQLNQSGIVERLQHQTTQMRNLDFRDYLRVYLPEPKPEEQSMIARVLKISNDALAVAEVKLNAARRLKAGLMQELFATGIPGRHGDVTLARVFRYQFKVPSAWEVQPLRDSVASVEYGTNAASNDGKHGLPVIAIPEVIASRFRLGECSYAEVSEQEAASLRLRPDDVLLIRTNGNSEYIGKSTVIGDQADGQHIIFASYLIRVRTKKEKLSGRYLNYFLESPLGRRQCLAMANTSAGNHNLASRAIKQFLFPRPSPSEQAEIVALVDAAEDAIEVTGEELEALDRLKRSLIQNLLTGRVRVAA
jgi:type I restriction enzyme, S subunit